MPDCTRRLFLAMSVASRVISQKRPPEDDTQSYWNKVYSADRPIFLQQPTALLVDAVKDRRPGKALDIGMGQGRNAIFLARQGWDVTGFDPSDEGVRQAQAQARKLGIPMHALVAREEAFDLGTAQWDLMVMTYVRRLRAGDAALFSLALKPQGIFVYENNNVGEQNELLRDFLAFRILRFEDVDTNSDWHPERKQRVERLVAQRLVKPQ
jgi:SAM-dependent methyltransferase